MRSAASTRRISSKLRNPTVLPSRPGSTRCGLLSKYPGVGPPISNFGRKSRRHEPTWTSVQLSRSRAAADLTGLRPRSGSRLVRDRDSPAGHATERPHHARRVSMSRSTCMASARSDSSSASSPPRRESPRPPSGVRHQSEQIGRPRNRRAILGQDLQRLRCVFVRPEGNRVSHRQECTTFCKTSAGLRCPVSGP